jgi:hypothetical protein
MTLSDPLGAYEIALRVCAALDAVGVPYFLGGSLASSLQGEPRASNDIDVVIDMPVDAVARFSQALGPDFDVDQEALAEAIRLRRSWNIFFLPLVFKVDLFQRGAGAFDQSEFGRRRLFQLAPGKELFVKTAEDSVIRKLLWYREGDEASTHQWRDVVEILRVSGPALDQAYLAKWVAALELGPLFERASLQAGSAG